MKNVRVLFVLKKRNMGYGPSFGINCSCDMVGKTLEKYGIEFKVVEVIDGNGIDKEVYFYKPTHVILEAIFCPAYKVLELINLYKKVQWSVRLHSETSFLAREGNAIEWLKLYWKIAETYKNFMILCNSKRILKELEYSIGIKSDYAPNIYFPEEYPVYKSKQQDDYLNIACFGAFRDLKAQFPQAISAMIYGNQTGKKIKFHINVDRLEGENTNSILKNVRNLFKDSPHILIEHEWMRHHTLIKLLQEYIDIGMAVSLTESYCITGYDYVMNDIPIVCSKELKHVLPIFQCDPVDYKSIVKALCEANNSRDTKLHLTNKNLVIQANQQATKEWLDLLSCSG
jgi:hypothetical protein